MMTWEDKREYNRLRQKLRHYMAKYHTTFGVNNGRLDCLHKEDMVFDGNGNSRDLTINELEEMISNYKKIDLLVEDLTNRTHIVY